MDANFYDLVDLIRKKMERGKNFYSLLADKPKWNQLCASLYAIVDAQSAIDAYTELEYPSDVKGKYLYTYGLLQALFLQQDAAKGISSSLLNKNINFRKEYPALYKIREIRNDATGHPTGRNHKDDCNLSYVQITQISMHKDGFRYAIYKDTNNFKFEEEHVDLRKCIDEQSKSMQAILAEICDLLDEEWRKHLEKFKDEKMVDIFKGLNYAKTKVLEDDYLAEAGLEEARNMVECCKSALNERYGDWRNIDCFRFEIEDIEEIFSLLGDVDIAINSRVDHYLSELMFIKMAELEECAKEIDEKFKLESCTVKVDSPKSEKMI